MKILASDLLGALKRVEQVVSNKGMLAHILIQSVGGEHGALIASDTVTTIRVRMNVNGAGSFLVLAADLQAAMRFVPDDMVVSLTSDKASTLFESVDRIHLRCLAKEAFIKLPKFEIPEESGNFEKIRLGLRLAAETSKGRRTAEGTVYLINDEHRKFYIIGTNGVTASMSVIEGQLPVSSLKLDRRLVVSLVEHMGGVISIGVKQGLTTLSDGKMDIITQQSGGREPNFKPLLSQSYLGRTTFKQEDMVRALNQAKLFMNDHHYIHFSVQPGFVNLTAHGGKGLLDTNVESVLEGSAAGYRIDPVLAVTLIELLPKGDVDMWYGAENQPLHFQSGEAHLLMATMA